MAHGIGYLSEDRKQYGLALGLDVGDEHRDGLPQQVPGLPGGREPARRAQDGAALRRGAWPIKTPSLQQRVKNLSGGNQQKVVIGKWLAADCDILIFDEPTARHRRGRQERDLPPAQRTGRPGQVHHHDLFRTAGDPAHEPPRGGHVRGQGSPAT